MTEYDPKELLKKAREAGRTWAARPPASRAAALREAGRLLVAHIDELAAILVEETHKPLGEAYSADLLGVGDLFAYWCTHGPKYLEPRKAKIPALDMPHKQGIIEREARGVVAVISPWNYPVALPLRVIVPALLAGNAVVFKPSEFTSRTGAWIVEMLQRTLGNLVMLAEGDGAAGAALIEARPDLVHFTGSVATGHKVAVRCAELGLPSEQELGGKDCAIVLPEADVERTARGIAWGIVHNAGQDCASIERVVVHGQIAPTFVPALVRAMQAAAPQVPALVTGAQRAIVLRHIQDALDRGGRLLTGGLPEGKAPIGPTLLTDVPRDALAWREESFGPIAVLEVLSDDSALLEAANDTAFGLGGSVWSSDLARAEALGRHMHTGMLWINNHAFTGALPDLPWVGRLASGNGITSSPEALFHLTRPRVVVIDKASAIEPWWYPYGESLDTLMKTLVQRQLSGGIGATLRTLGALTKRNKALKD